MFRRLLLLSTSRIYGKPYLSYCRDHIQAFWGEQQELMFIPYAAQNHDKYFQLVKQHLEPMGFTVDSLHHHENEQRVLEQASGIFVGGGNTFLLAKTLQEKKLYSMIQARVNQGEMRYMGSSAGSNIACPGIHTTNDMPIVQPPSFDALGLIPFQINAHYLDPAPDSKHMGETREKRIEEYHEWNHLPVLGLREGALLEIHNETATLKGTTGARLFQANQPPLEYTANNDLSFLLSSNVSAH